MKKFTNIVGWAWIALLVVLIAVYYINGGYPWKVEFTWIGRN